MSSDKSTENKESSEQALQAGFNLSWLSPAEGSTSPRKRKGIGPGSGNGKTCGKGQKGQKSRSGFGLLAGFEGGQMPLHRRLPKRGFTSRKKTLGKNVYQVVSLSKIAEKLSDLDSTNITLDNLRESGVLGRGKKLKLLDGKDFKEKIVVEAHAASASAIEAISAAGGEVKIIKAQKKAEA